MKNKRLFLLLIPALLFGCDAANPSSVAPSTTSSLEPSSVTSSVAPATSSAKPSSSSAKPSSSTSAKPSSSSTAERLPVPEGTEEMILQSGYEISETDVSKELKKFVGETKEIPSFDAVKQYSVIEYDMDIENNCFYTVSTGCFIDVVETMSAGLIKAGYETEELETSDGEIFWEISTDDYMIQYYLEDGLFFLNGFVPQEPDPLMGYEAVTGFPQAKINEAFGVEVALPVVPGTDFYFSSDEFFGYKIVSVLVEEPVATLSADYKAVVEAAGYDCTWDDKYSSYSFEKENLFSASFSVNENGMFVLNVMLTYIPSFTSMPNKEINAYVGCNVNLPSLDGDFTYVGAEVQDTDGLPAYIVDVASTDPELDVKYNAICAAAGLVFEKDIDASDDSTYYWLNDEDMGAYVQFYMEEDGLTIQVFQSF